MYVHVGDFMSFTKIINIISTFLYRNFKKEINKIFYKPKIYTEGKNNIIDIADNASSRRFKTEIYGNNNKIQFDNGSYVHNSHFRIGFSDANANNCSVYIGQNTGINSLDLHIGESESCVTIGNDCMISYDVQLVCTDTHSITDMDNNLLNRGKFIEIGSHVWICKEVKIMKNTKIPNGCIVAQGSTVTKQFEKENCIIAGNPAKIVKENIIWHRTRPENFGK